MKYEDYTVGWICALPTEMAAARGMLDEIHETLPSLPHDNNNYTFGRIGDHNVVIACLPSGVMGKISATGVVTQLPSTCTGIEFGLMVGIGGGVPSKKHDIRLGDVVVSKPTGTYGGVIQYDFGKTVEEGKFIVMGSLNKPPKTLLTALASLEAKHMTEDHMVAKHLSEMTKKHPKLTTHSTCPDVRYDSLYTAEYDHPKEYDTCSQCDANKLVIREPRASEGPLIHYGLVASGDQVMRHGGTRERLRQELDVLCFEMEAAGLMDILPCLVIRGICDYADSHKNKQWQPYAAAAASAYAKELLSVIPGRLVIDTQTAAGVTAAAVDSRFQEVKLEEVNACLTALFLTDPRDDRETITQIKGSRVDGTCEWIKSNALYDSWLHSHSQLLRLSGGPGKGKTMLSVFLAEELERRVEDSDSSLFVQYFCDNRDEKRNTAVTVLRALIWQLLKRRPQLVIHILPSFRDRDKSQLITSFTSLWNIFEHMVNDPVIGTAYCVLDGLDECDEGSLEVLLKKFSSLFSTKSDQSSTCHLNLIAVSRELPDFIPEILSIFPCIQLDPDADSEINTDIRQFIKIRVNELSKYRQLPEPLRIHVEKVLLTRAKGTFLWVGIVAHELRKYKATEIERALNLFPSGLEELYARILLQIDDDRQQTAAKILRWVVMAFRPLTLLELSAAIETTVTSIGFSHKEVVRDQVAYCGYFLTIKEDRVSLIHQSAKDYLLRQTPDCNPKLEYFRIKEEAANLEIARKCFEYLQGGVFAWDKVNLVSLHTYQDFPLLLYATLHWPDHARRLASSEDIFDLTLPFYAEKSRIRESWLETYWLASAYGRTTPSFPLLHFASYFGIIPLVENLLSRRKSWMNRMKHLTFVNKRDSSGRTPLYWAATQGHETVVRLLLKQGANVNTKDIRGCSMLYDVVERGDRTVARLLLENGANVNASYSGEIALVEAARRGDKTMINLLLEYNADVSMRDTHGLTALSLAANNGNKTVVQLLLKYGADHSVKDNHGWTTLHEAACEGHQAVVQLLLEYGADINLKTNYKDTSLCLAAFKGHQAVVQLLLKHGAQVHLKDCHGLTALHWAAEGGHKAVVRLLLEHGVDVYMKDDKGRTALCVAVGFGYKTVVQLLLEHGVDVHMKDDEGRTALFVAAAFEYKAIVQLLLEHGADVHMKDNQGRTALDVAAAWGRKEVVQLLEAAAAATAAKE